MSNSFIYLFVVVHGIVGKINFMGIKTKLHTESIYLQKRKCQTIITKNTINRYNVKKENKYNKNRHLFILFDAVVTNTCQL